MNRLFLICPECCLESKIINHFGDNSFFYTSLAAIFDFSDFKLMEEINQVIVSESITEILIVNDLQCTFILETILGEPSFNSNSTRILKQLTFELKNDNEISKLKPSSLCYKSITYMSNQIRETAFVGGKIEKGELGLKGLLYNRVNNEFEEILI